MDSASQTSNYIVLDWFTRLKSPVWWITMHHGVPKYKTNQIKGSWLGIGYKSNERQSKEKGLKNTKQKRSGSGKKLKIHK